MANDQTTQAVESLAAEIGENIYMDVAKWHLYLADAHLHTVVAEKVYPMIENEEVSEDGVIEILRQISVSLGGGRREVPLLELLPLQCQMNLMDLLEEFLKK
ncbi:DUF3181 family protein [Crocosphaera watsonii WH 8501]|uniref:Thylakoid-associated protein n=6 Tax=Crocosphaera watsonii TaxID=263511 RepID=Q4BYP3_CROWT|nr:MULTISPECIES: DUF3181 family protein [Crocosphaera]EAM49028.1 hypothetical protein CwatDRAFT_2195 [Crocosphaera watsonii WH 8501]EHJ14072.1 hypothetical protein CWATWH0003_1265 [Crocosphaera watsonii WH 0003]MCH2244243.1 DUF3181 family protein [Crocosphaera sp.]NQZ63413.1 DUF3181 family protein [Crocosphaera sp.]CCQ51430.1 hypothetical protein CWATWH8502_1970 [Crocosphaera watsonii WH 8502]